MDLTGRRFGRLTILSRSKNRARRVYWKCRCKCGTEKEVASVALRKGEILSCGCYSRDIQPKRMTALHAIIRTHGMSRTPTYRIWGGMIGRCHNSNNSNYERYGAKGIYVCERWRDFRNFLADMGKRPSSEHSIDRIDNSKGYEPGNCRWATAHQQNNNSAGLRLIIHGGRTLTLTQWAERTGIERRVIAARLDRLGWSVEKTLTRRPGSQGRKKL